MQCYSLSTAAVSRFPLYYLIYYFPRGVKNNPLRQSRAQASETLPVAVALPRAPEAAKKPPPRCRHRHLPLAAEPAKPSSSSLGDGRGFTPERCSAIPTSSIYCVPGSARPQKYSSAPSQVGLGDFKAASQEFYFFFSAPQGGLGAACGCQEASSPLAVVASGAGGCYK